MPRPDRIRVVVVDDDAILTEALGQVWGRGGEIEIVGVAHTGEDSLTLVAHLIPNVILMDYHLPDMTGATATAALRTALPDIPILVLTRDDSDDVLLGALEAGASGFLLKRSGIREVSEAVRHAAAGEMLVSAATMTRLMVALAERRRHSAEERLAERLTSREMEVLRLMAEGLDTRTMAEQLVLGQTTIRTHVANVLSKLGAHSRLGAVAQATRLGFLS